MNRIFYNTLIFILTLFLGGVAVVFSIRPGETQQTIQVSTDSTVWNKLQVNQIQPGEYSIKTEVIDPVSVRVSKDTPMMVEFGRLSSFLFLAPLGAQTGVLTQTGTDKTHVVLGDVSGIMSLYDLFKSYTIYDSQNMFRLEQFTNGSFYIGKEKDEKVAIYAIDGVVRLVLMHQNEDMTSLILFPGSYIRFDPLRNRSLKNADLFRTILSLKDTDNEVFEFVNPRVNIGDDQDTFFNYRLPVSSIVLFRVLSTRFKEKVDSSDLSRRYGISSYTQGGEESGWLMNPSKKNYNLLLELSHLLMRAINSPGNTDTLIANIGTKYTQASSLNLKDSSAKTLVEQFLLDGRFALYAGASNAKYQQTYEDIARIIGIEREDAKSRFFQSLADIYSRNLFTQKQNDARLTINTFGPTASELAKIFDQPDIERKDYFDIAIYAYNILRKVEDRSKVLLESSMLDQATYSYFLTFFQASSRYIESIDVMEKKQQTIMSFSRQFYDYMLSLLVNSLYKTFVMNDDGALYLNATYVNGFSVNIPEEILANMSYLHQAIKLISPTIEAMWTDSGERDTDIFIRIKRNIVLLDAFVGMISSEGSEGYKEYTKSPYKTEDQGSEVPLPLFEKKGSSTLVRVDPKIIERQQTNRTLAMDPRIQEIESIWRNLDRSLIGLEGDDIRISRAPYMIARSTGQNSEIEITSLYRSKNFYNTEIRYKDFIIEVFTDRNAPISYNAFRALLLQVHSYLDFIDTEILEQGSDVRSLRIFPSRQRIKVGDSLYPVEVREIEIR